MVDLQSRKMKNKAVPPSIIFYTLLKKAGFSVSLFLLASFSHRSFAQTYISMNWQSPSGQQGLWLVRPHEPATFSTWGLLVPGNGWQLVAKGDCNGDTIPDLLWRNKSGALAVWEMARAAIANYYVLETPAVSPEWRLINWSDWDGDGDLDILWQHENSALAIWHMQGRSISSFRVPTELPQPGSNWKVVAVKDLNGDGSRDFLWQQIREGLLGIWALTNAFEVISYRMLDTIPVGRDWRVVGVDDFTGDGRLNLLWENSVTRKFALWNFHELKFTATMAQAGEAIVLDTPTPAAGWTMWSASPLTYYSGGSSGFTLTMGR